MSACRRMSRYLTTVYTLQCPAEVRGSVAEVYHTRIFLSVRKLINNSKDCNGPLILGIGPVFNIIFRDTEKDRVVNFHDRPDYPKCGRFRLPNPSSELFDDNMKVL